MLLFFSEIYKKAKSIGGNSYFMKPAENIEGNSTFNPHHYILYIYYKEKQTIPQKENTVYLINPEKEIEVRINKKNKVATEKFSSVRFISTRDYRYFSG